MVVFSTVVAGLVEVLLEKKVKYTKLINPQPSLLPPLTRKLGGNTILVLASLT